MFKKFRFNIYIPRGRMGTDGKENQGLRVGEWKGVLKDLPGQVEQ